MATLVKKAASEKKSAVRKFTVGETIQWSESYHDGRTMVYSRISGEVIRINKKTLTVKDSDQDIWRVAYDEIL